MSVFGNILTSGLPLSLAWWILGLPLLIFLFLMFFGRMINRYRGYMATTVMFVNFGLALTVFLECWNGPEFVHNYEWFVFGERSFSFGLRIDWLTSLMMLIVTSVSFLVHLFSIEYLRGDRHFEKYFAYLGLFTFSMLGIVLSSNLLMIFVFWELVGVSSYLLIGFYFKKESAVFANKKAFIVNRIGDAGFLIGILALYALFGTLDLQTLHHLFTTTNVLDSLAESGSYSPLIITVAGIGLFMGCVGKSAQFPLQVWLPNAMEGPTPVSALIHAATMVAAGIYLLARVYTFLDVPTLNTIAIIGTVTAFMGGFAALVQTDIKRVLAFSTISQLGYMVMGMGVGAYDAALFHLLTHAFFKACLFLSAGAVIHSMHHLETDLQKEGQDLHFDPQDMRLMGGLRKRMPVTFVAFSLATFALAGLPLFSGFLSKDAILAGALGWATSFTEAGGSSLSYAVPVLGFVTAFLTAAYMGRQLILVFFGDFRLPKFKDVGDVFHRVIETPWLMRFPIVVLALMSVGFVFSGHPFDGSHGWFMTRVEIPEVPMRSQALTEEMLTEAAHHFHGLSSLISVVLALSGIGIAILLYRKGMGSIRSKIMPDGGWLKRLSQENWLLDELYDVIIVRSTILGGRALYWFDRVVVDGMVNAVARAQVVKAALLGWFDRAILDGVVNGVVFLTGRAGLLLRASQGGKIQVYLGLLIVLLVVVVVVIMKWFMT